MNNYQLIFGGAPWIMVLLMLAAITFTVLTYRRTNPPIPMYKKTMLAFLRALALLSLLFFIFEPVLTKRTGIEKAPVLRVLADNSSSMAMQDASGEKKNKYADAFQKLESGLKKLDAQYYAFNKSVENYDAFQFDSLNLEGQFTDISKAINLASRNNDDDNIRAMLLISDGQYNSGDNPIYAIENVDYPIYTLAIGDSTIPKDVVLKSVLTNEIAYVNSVLPVNVKVSINGYETGDSIVIKLNEKLSGRVRNISEQIIYVNENQTEYSLLFDYKAVQAGYANITATAQKKEGELTELNNKQNQTIKILDKKNVVAIFGGAPNSDIAFINKYLSEERDIEVKQFIQKKGGDFYITPNATDLEDIQLFVFSDFPNSSTPNSVIKLIIEQLGNNKPLLFISGFNTDYRKLQQFDDYLPFITIKTGKREFTASPYLDAHSLNSSLINITGTDSDLGIWNKLPPIFKTETFVRVKPESQFVAGLNINGVDLQQPLILSRYWQGQKTISILGYGLYRWKLMGKAADEAAGNYDSYDVFSIFMNNCMKWLSVTEKNKRFIVKTVEKEYAQGETIEFIGELYDRAYTPIDNAEINVKIPLGSSDYSDLLLHSLGNGRYAGSIEGLEVGDYIFSAKATKDDRALGKTNGYFSIEAVSPEAYNINMNARLLREIATRSGGKFYTAEQVDEVIEDIMKDAHFKPYSITITNDINLWNKIQLLILAIVCFALEWFFRKRNGLL